MQPICFLSDYMEGAHSEILRRLCDTQMEQLSGYGTDEYTASAKERIKAACECPEAQVYLRAAHRQKNSLSTFCFARTRVLSPPTAD